MADKTPDQWPDYYTPSNSEWRGGFYWARDQAIAGAGSAANSALTAALLPLPKNPATIDLDMATHAIHNASNLTQNPAVAVQDMANNRIANLAAAMQSTDAVRLGQVRSRVISLTSFSSPQATVVQSIPVGYGRFRMDVENIVPSAAGFPYVRFSFDGGASYSQGTSDYAWVLSVSTVASTPAVTYANGSTLFQVGNNQLTSTQSGFLEFCPDDKTIFASWWGSSSTALYSCDLKGRSNLTGTPTHVLFALSGGAMTSGRVRFAGLV